MCRDSECAALLATKLAGYGKVVGVRRNIGYGHTWRSRWTGRIAGTLGAMYVANCDAAREFASRVEWIPRRRICVIRNPVLSERREEALAMVPPRSSVGIVDGEQVVGMVATVRPIKDYATFLRSAQSVLRKHPRTRFLAIGMEDPDYASQMRKLANDLGIDAQLSWLGAVPNPLGLLPLVDVAVLSSRSEAMSNAIVEYMAMGVAVVTTRVGGTPEIVEDEVTGFLVPPCSPEPLADRICHLLEDAALRTRMGQTAQTRIRELCSEDKIVNQYVTFYRGLIGK